MRHYTPLSLWVVVLAIVGAGCAAPARPPSQADNPQTALRSPQSPKRITAAIKGDPPTLSEAINSAGAGGTDGLTELEQLVHIGLGVVDSDGRLAARLGETCPRSRTASGSCSPTVGWRRPGT